RREWKGVAASSDRPPEGLARVVRPHTWRRRTLKLVLGVAAVLLVLRMAAPFVIEAAINHRLARIPEYRGKVADVDLFLLRGAYALDDVDVRKRGNEGDAPFFAARRIDFSVAWRELFNGRIVSDIAVEQARLVFVRAHTEQESTLETDERWQDVIQDVFPIEIEHLEIRGGDLHYVDETQTPEVDVSIRELHVVATGLRNRKRSWDEDILPAAVSAE